MSNPQRPQDGPLYSQQAASPLSRLTNERRRITAVLGPTNTGKTHLAIDRMTGHASGMIGLPLRLLAREVYDRVVRIKGVKAVALITGEERILPPEARYYICTVEAMPLQIEVDFLAIDEIQLAADRERGHIFTDRLLYARGRYETMMLGSETIRPLIQKLLPDTIFITRPRFSELTWTGAKKLTRLPRRSAIVAFSADAVYALAELIRRQRGGAAVVMGGLSPRTRNAQVALYQSGDVDFLVATDAIGMGLNMDVDHVAFAATEKFDGREHRPLRIAELAQIAGRAGRYMNDGSFGITGDASPLSDEMIERIEQHQFDADPVLQWRNPDLKFDNIDALMRSLEVPPARSGLVRAQIAADLEALTRMSRDPDVQHHARTPQAIRKLWEVAQVPDFRKTLAGEHATLLTRLYLFLMEGDKRVPEDWLSGQMQRVDHTEGDIDTLSARLAHVRTWTYVANRSDWLHDPQHWQERARAVEDRLSDALHERLTQRFIDRRTSILMKRLRQNEDLMAAVNLDGEVLVEGEFVGRLHGFVFVPDPRAEGEHGKVLRAASEQAVGLEITARAARIAAAPDTDITLSEHGRLIWDGSPVAQLKLSDTALNPRIELIAGEELQGSFREGVVTRLENWFKQHIATVLAPLVALRDATEIEGLARGIAFRLVENLGSLRRDLVAEDVRALDQAARGQLRKHGVRFGAYSIFLPALLKPAPARLLMTLWSLTRKDAEGVALDPLADLPQPPTPGLTSVPADPAAPAGFYDALGFRVCGTRAVRIDMLERVADLIRPVIANRTYNGGFIVTPDMMSLVGCSGEEFASLLKGLGYRAQIEKITPKLPATEAPAPKAEETASSVAATAKAASAEDAAPQVPAPEGAATETISPETGETPVADVPAEVPPVETAPLDVTPEETSGTTRAGEPVSETAAEPTSEPVSAATASAEAAPAAEPVELEIWRPVRRNKPQQQNRSARRRPAARSADSAAPAEGTPADGEKTDARPRRDNRRDGNKSERPNRSNQDRNAKGGKPQGNREDNRGPKGRNADKGRNDKDGGSKGYRDPKPNRREPDPDSPFAALAILKERGLGK